MAELPRLRSDPAPARPARPVPPPPLFDRTPAFGVNRELELLKQGALAPRTPRPLRSGRVLGRAPRERTGFRSRWDDGDHGPASFWHRLRCKTGHHEIRGGHQLQLGSEFVYVERRCRWCDKLA